MQNIPPTDIGYVVIRKKAIKRTITKMHGHSRHSRTIGWVGFGIAEVASNNMTYYDVAIGGVTDDGTSYLQVGRNNKI